MEKRGLLTAVLGTLLLQLFLTGFFNFGKSVPLTIDTHLGNYQLSAFHFPPQGTFNTDYWLGMPQLPNGLHPLSLYAHLPFWIFATTFYPLCAALSVYFTSLLFRIWNFRPFSSIFAGLLFAWQGSFLSNLLPAHFSPAALFAFFPLTLYLITRAHQNRSLLTWAWAGVGSGMMLLFLPDQGFLANLLIGAFLLFLFFRNDFEKKPENFTIRSLLFGVLIWALLTFLTALPGIEGIVLQNIHGVQQGSGETAEKKYEWATQWSFPPEEIIQYLVPGFLGWHNLSEEGPYWGRIGQSADWNAKDQGMRNYMLGINSLGTIATILSLIGIAGFFKRYRKNDLSLEASNDLDSPRKIARFFFFAGLIYLLFGLGKYAPFYTLFYHLPGMQTWRNPLKFILLPGTFTLIVLSTWGAQRLFEAIQSKEKEPTTFNHFYGFSKSLLWGLLFLFPLYLLLTVILPAVLPLFQYSPSESGRIVGTILGSILIAILIASLWFLLVTLISRSSVVRHYPLLNPFIAQIRDTLFKEKNLEMTWSLGLSLLVVAQMMWVQNHYLFQRPLPMLSQSSEMIRFLKKEGTPVRVKLMTRDSLLDEHLNIRFPLHHIACADIPAASRTPNDYQTFFSKLTPFPLRQAEISGVQYLIGATSAWVQYAQDPAFKAGLGKTTFFAPQNEEENILTEIPEPNGSLYAVTEIKNALPRISVIPHAETFSDEESLLKRLQDPLWNPKESILLLNSINSNPTTPQNPSTPSPQKPTLQVLSYTPQEIKVTVETSIPGYLLITDRFDPDWKATINGAEVPILKANFIERAIPFTPGKSEIILRYSPSNLAVYLQLLTLLSLTVLSIRVTRNAHACASIPHNKL